MNDFYLKTWLQFWKTRPFSIKTIHQKYCQDSREQIYYFIILISFSTLNLILYLFQRLNFQIVFEFAFQIVESHLYPW